MTIVQAAEAQVHIAGLNAELRLATEQSCVDSLQEFIPLIMGNGSQELQALLSWTLAIIPLKLGSLETVRAKTERWALRL